MPRQPKPPAPPKPWRREAGAYRSSDDRFTIESGGAGRWFLTDDESLDELGLARTLGPYDTLDEAKAAAVEQREQATEPSPLAGRIAAAKDRPTTRAAAISKATTKRSGGRSGGAARAGDAARDEAGDESDGRAASEGETRRETAAPERTWLDELEDDDRAAAVRARRLVEALDALGVSDADRVVRRDLLGRQPAIAATLLGRSLATALADRLAPEALERDGRRAIPEALRDLRAAGEPALAAYAAFVAARVLEATLRVVAGEERAEGAGRELPGWRLVERPGAGDPGDAARRLIVTTADVGRG